MPRREIAGSHGNTIGTFLRNPAYWFPCPCTIYIPTISAPGFQFLHSIASSRFSLFCLCKNHHDEYEMYLLPVLAAPPQVQSALCPLWLLLFLVQAAHTPCRALPAFSLPGGRELVILTQNRSLSPSKDSCCLLCSSFIPLFLRHFCM